MVLGGSLGGEASRLVLVGGAAVVLRTLHSEGGMRFSLVGRDLSEQIPVHIFHRDISNEA